jgi:hypothetical protein
VSALAVFVGLPTLKAAAGFRAYDEFEDEFYFEYPKVTQCDHVPGCSAGLRQQAYSHLLPNHVPSQVPEPASGPCTASCESSTRSVMTAAARCSQ